jgi:hypothetical protein
MKKALAIICCLLLIGTLFVPAPATAGDDRSCISPSCCHACAATCCAARPSPSPQPASTAPVPSGSENQFSPPPLLSNWTLPETGASESAAFLSLPLISADAPLYARNCVRLI